MGCNPSVDAFCGDGGLTSEDEWPARVVTLSAFSIHRREVTQAEYERCRLAGSCPMPSCQYNPATFGARPVVCVTRAAAASYCAWLGARLPTEAEWEKAARGVDGGLYPWGNAPADATRASFNTTVGNDWGLTGRFPAGASPWGGLDLAGHVAEWVADNYSATAYQTEPLVNPRGPDAGFQGVIRGGDWASAASELRCSARQPVALSLALLNIGFRCAR
jgi:formylglycine-generating enzyme required for sulfatase activity